MQYAPVIDRRRGSLDRYAWWLFFRVAKERPQCHFRGRLSDCDLRYEPSANDAMAQVRFVSAEDGDV
jgi:hypothetical protein